MKIGLIDVDSHNYPNLALMKISAYHKAQGDEVEWWWGWGQYDKVYMSKVFDDTYTRIISNPSTPKRSSRAAPATAWTTSSPTRSNTCTPITASTRS